MPQHRLFDLVLSCPFALSSALPCEGKTVDVEVKYTVHPPDHLEIRDTPYSQVSALQAMFYWPQEASYEVRKGRFVDIHPLGPISPPLMELSLLGPVLSALLHQRGRIPFHGAALTHGGQAHVFMADSGMGKSTLAAHLVAQGFGFMSDDIVLVQKNNAGFQVVPSYPSLKLDQDRVERYGFSGSSLTKLDPHFEKWIVNMRQYFVVSPQPLGSINILEYGEFFCREPLTGTKAYLALLQMTHTAKWLTHSPQAIEHLQQCADIIKNVPLFKVTYPHSEASLDQLAQAVLQVPKVLIE